MLLLVLPQIGAVCTLRLLCSMICIILLYLLEDKALGIGYFDLFPDPVEIQDCSRWPLLIAVRMRRKAKLLTAGKGTPIYGMPGPLKTLTNKQINLLILMLVRPPFSLTMLLVSLCNLNLKYAYAMVCVSFNICSNIGFNCLLTLFEMDDTFPKHAWADILFVAVHDWQDNQLAVCCLVFECTVPNTAWIFFLALHVWTMWVGSEKIGFLCLNLRKTRWKIKKKSLNMNKYEYFAKQLTRTWCVH